MGVFGAAATTGTEQWSWGLRINPGLGAAFDESKKTAFLAGIQGATNGYHVDTYMKNHANAWLTHLTCAYIGEDGKYVGGDTQPTTVYTYSPAVKGTGATTVPWSHSRVITLRSSIERGAGAYGRFYTPCGETVQLDGRFDPSAQQTVADVSRTYIDTVNTQARLQWPGANVSIMSTVGTLPIGRVIAVGAGLQPDTQRRRDNRLPEVHKYANLTTAAAELASRQERQYA